MTGKRQEICIGILVIALLVLAAPAMAAVTISPTGGDDTASIAAAISSAALDDHIVILNRGTYHAHDIVVAATVTVRAADGNGPSDTIIDADSLGRIFDDSGSFALAIDNLTLQNGIAPATYGGHGGAVFTYNGDITLTSSVIGNCRAYPGGSGGAVYTMAGNVMLTSTTITGCQAGDSTFPGEKGGDGGAIFTYAGNVAMMLSTITGCRAGNSINYGGGDGGAIFAGTGSVTATLSTIALCRAGNTPSGAAGNGGAIDTAGGSVTATSSMFLRCRTGDGSFGGYGGAIYAVGDSTVRFSRIVPNTTGGAVISGSVDAADNWWGSNAGPSPSDLDGGAVAGTWLLLGISADPSTITTAETSTIRTNLTTHTDGITASPVSGTGPNGIPVTFMAGGGWLPMGYVVLTESGRGTTTFNPIAGAGTATVYAILDNETASVPITVTSAPSVPVRNVTSIAVDPFSAATVYAGVDTRGIYRSTDSGSSWTPATGQPANLNIRALAINSTHPGTLYTGTYGGGVYYSTDSGDHWSACSPPGNMNVLSLVRTSSGALFAGTEDGVYVSSSECRTWLAMNNGLS